MDPFLNKDSHPVRRNGIVDPEHVECNDDVLVSSSSPTAQLSQHHRFDPSR